MKQPVIVVAVLVSWWVGVSRDDWPALVKDQNARMNKSVDEGRYAKQETRRERGLTDGEA